MRIFLKFISLMICFELILIPINQGVIVLPAIAQTCPAGFSFDTALNRCLTNKETTQVMNAANQCGTNNECHKQNAQDFTQKKIAEGAIPERVENKQMMSTVGNALAVAGPLTVALLGTSKSTSKCASPSFWSMVAGSAAFIIGDNLANLQHAGRLKKIKQEWGKVVNPVEANGNKDKERETSTEAQGQSFEMLAQAEESLATAATLKQKFYMVAGLAFSASAIMAGLELINHANPGNICGPAAEKPAPAPALEAAPEANGVIDLPTPNAPAPVTPGTSPELPTGEGEISVDLLPQANVFQKKRESIFEYYVNNGFENFLDHKFHENLKNSKDIVSFIVNKEAISQKDSSPSLDYYMKIKNAFRDMTIDDKSSFDLFKELSLSVISGLSPLSSAYAVDTNAAKAYKDEEAKGVNWMGLGIGALAGGAAGLAMRKVFKGKLVHPSSRLILSGLMAGWTMVMYGHAKKQAEASTERAALLRKMKEEFNSATGTLNTCKSEDREDPAKPDCFCYTPENQKNTNRSNSDVCKKLWEEVNLEETNYLIKPISAKVCITNNQVADPKCNCRSNNSCMKVGVKGLSGLKTGSFSVLSRSVDPLNKISNGSSDAANLSESSLANQAARLKNLAKEIEKSPALRDLMKGKAKEEALVTKELKNISSKMTDNPLLGSFNSLPMPKNPGEAARMIEKDIDSQIPKSTGSENHAIGVPGHSSSNDKMETGFGDSDPLSEGKIPDGEDKELDYGDNDINAGSNSTIFELLSNRYQRSGMKRLFDETVDSQIDPPSRKEIIVK